MTNQYRDLSDRDLLIEIQQANRVPPPALVEEGCRRGADIELGLCQILDDPITDDGYGGHVLAGLLLIEARSLVSIPHFASLYRDPYKEPVLSPWFDGQLPNIGPSLIQPFRNLLMDDSAILPGRTSAIEILNAIAGLYPDRRDSIVAGIRGVVQSLGNSDRLDDGQLELLSWSVSALVDLGDRESADIVKQIADRPSEHSETMSELAEYAQLLIEGSPSPDVARPAAIQELYAAVQKWDDMTAQQVVDHYKEAMLESGVDENLVSSLMSIALARFIGDQTVESGQDLVAALKSTLSSAGVSEPDLDSAVKELLVTVFAYDGIESETVLPIGVERTLRLKFNR